MKNFLAGIVLLFGVLITSQADAANRFAVCVATCTWDGASTAMWSTTTGGATGASVPGSSDAVLFDAATCVGGVTCTVTVNTTVNIQSIQMGACTASTTGCIIDFNANNNNVTLSANPGYNGSGTGLRTLKMGSGTWTLSNATAGSTPWSMGTTTNLTLDPGTSTIVYSGAPTTGTLSFSGSSLTYNNLTINSNSSKGGVTFTGSNTFNVVTITSPNSVFFTSATTQTVTTLNAVGTLSSLIEFASSSIATAATISKTSGTMTLQYVGLRAMTFSGGATFVATNSYDFGLNSGITITPPAATSSGNRVSPGIGQ